MCVCVCVCVCACIYCRQVLMFKMVCVCVRECVSVSDSASRKFGWRECVFSLAVLCVIFCGEKNPRVV